MPVADVPPHLSADAELLFAAVREAGAMGLELSSQRVRNWQKPDGSTVTEADHAINDFLQQRLMGQRPDYGWLSEETPDTPKRLANEHLWVVDPIDGTNSFVNGTDGWCIGAALVPFAADALLPFVEFHPSRMSIIQEQSAVVSGKLLMAVSHGTVSATQHFTVVLSVRFQWHPVTPI